MRLGMRLKLEIHQVIDEANAMAIIRKKLSRSPEEIVEMLSLVGVTQ
jgi:hypothetical protein